MQMLGVAIDDPHDVEGGGRDIPGLGLLDLRTSMSPVKTARQVTGSFADRARFGDAAMKGYEIHVGETSRGDADPLFVLTRTGTCEVVEDGAVRRDGRVLGTYVHGVFDEPACALAILNHLRALRGFAPLGPEAIEQRGDPYARLAAHFRAHLDMDSIYESLGMKVPA